MFAQFVNSSNGPSRPRPPAFARQLPAGAFVPPATTMAPAVQPTVALYRPIVMQPQPRTVSVTTPRVMPALRIPSRLQTWSFHMSTARGVMEVEQVRGSYTQRPVKSKKLARPMSARVHSESGYGGGMYTQYPPPASQRKRPSSAPPMRTTTPARDVASVKSSPRMAVIPFLPPQKPLSVAVRRQLLSGAQRTFVKLTFNNPLTTEKRAHVVPSIANHLHELQQGTHWVALSTAPNSVREPVFSAR